MDNFKEIGLKEEILQGLEDLGFETPTAIQAQAIPHLISSEQDLIAFAQTGTGKTAAFSLPILHQVDTDSKKIQALILSPTRELCLQICRDIESYSKKMKGLRVTAVYGGASIGTQISELKRGTHIVVGTPGRTLDLINRKKLDFTQIRWMVLDEADEMLSMGFKEDLNAILEGTPEDKQNLLFSATMPKEIIKISKKYMTDPLEISAGSKESTTQNVSHGYYVVRPSDRYTALKRIADMHPQIYAIIFCRTRRETKEVADRLGQEGYNTDALHGDLSQAQRDHVMKRFRKKRVQLLVATDVAARGIDVTDLTHVINYNLPDDLATYVHRSGRTGRAAKKGISVSIVHSREMNRIRQMERKIGQKIERKMVPTGEEICAKQLFNLIDKVEKTEPNDMIEQYLPTINEKLSYLSKEDLVKLFLSMEFNRFLAYYKGAKDINSNEKSSRGGRDRDRGGRDRRDRDRGGRDRRDRDRGGRDRDRGRRDRRMEQEYFEGGNKWDKQRQEKKEKRGRSNFSRYFINIGKRDKLDPGGLLNFINQNIPKENVEIGKIDIQRSFSFFEVENTFDDMIPHTFSGKDYKGIKVMVEPASAENRKEKKGKKKDYDRGGDWGDRSKGRDRRRGDDFKSDFKKKKKKSGDKKKSKKNKSKSFFF